MSFAKAKREHKKIEARQEKRDLDEKYKALEEEMKLKHAEELSAFEPEAACLTAGPLEIMCVYWLGPGKSPVCSCQRVNSRSLQI